MDGVLIDSEHISKRLGAKPQKCLVIGYSKNGVIVAKNTKMKCIGFRNFNL